MYQYKEQQRWVRKRRMLLSVTQRELAQCLVFLFSDSKDPLFSAHVRVGEIERGCHKITKQEEEAIKGYFNHGL